MTLSRRAHIHWIVLLIPALLAGCSGFRGSPGGFNAAAVPVLENPILVPVTDRELVWNQVVNELDGYFKIRREERIRLIGNVLTEGVIETYPRPGSTLLEPHRRDSTPGYEKLHGTLQSVRRRATVRVIPTTGGHKVDVVVIKELEDMPQPEYSTVGGALLRHDSSLERYEDEEILGDAASSAGTGFQTWIPLGRDVSLEQRILANIQARLNVNGGPITPLPQMPLEFPR